MKSTVKTKAWIYSYDSLGDGHVFSRYHMTGQYTDL